MWLFSDKWRWAKILLVTVVLLTSGIINSRLAHKEWKGLYQQLDNPAAYAGQLVPFSYAKVLGVTATTLDVFHKGRKVTITAPGHIFKPYNSITFRARLEPDGVIRLIDYHQHYTRYHKLLIALLAMVVLFWLISRHFYFNPRRLLLWPKKAGF